MYLPNMATDDGIRKVTTENFGGYNHTLAAKNGMIWDEENIVSDFFPLLSPRGKRYLQNTSASFSFTLPKGRIRGDVNGNGEIDYGSTPWEQGGRSDNIYVLAHLAGLISLDGIQARCADVNEDGTIDSSDALSIERRAGGAYDEYENTDFYGNWTWDGENHNWYRFVTVSIPDREHFDPSRLDYDCDAELTATGLKITVDNPPASDVLVSYEKPNGFYCNDGLFWVFGTKFYADGVEKGTVENSRKTFASLGRYIVILPDKAYYDTLTGTFGSMESSTPSGFTATFTDGTYAEEPAEANTVKAASGFDWSDYFRPGDAVTISGASNPQNNTTIIVREISGNELRFYPNSFHVETTAEAITVKRSIPDMDFICENENRLWGCKGDSIFSTKLGDIFNWNVFDGVATDSYAVDVGSVGDFTGCCSYLGYPIFFKEEHIYKVYGDKPSNYQVMGSASLGTAVGAGRSIAIAGETLFYLARTGIVAYNGGIPTNISSAFGMDKYTDAVGGSDGVKYYVSMKDESGHWSIFTYDTRYGVWHREDEKQVIDFGWNQNLYFLDSSGKIWLNWDARNPTGTAESAIHSMVEFADFTEPVGNSPRYGANKKGVSKVQMRVELDANATLKVQIKFDSSDTWIDIKTLTTTRKRSFYLPIIPRRGDHFRIKLTGTGDWKLYALTRESYSGSEL